MVVGSTSATVCSPILKSCQHGSGLDQLEEQVSFSKGAKPADDIQLAELWKTLEAVSP
jgi:hypothetical protein